MKRASIVVRARAQRQKVLARARAVGDVELDLQVAARRVQRRRHGAATSRCGDDARGATSRLDAVARARAMRARARAGDSADDLERLGGARDARDARATSRARRDSKDGFATRSNDVDALRALAARARAARGADAAAMLRRCVDALTEARDDDARYYAALTMHRALATRANRDDASAVAACVEACVMTIEKRAGERGEARGAIRRETVAVAALTVARARGPDAAAAALGGDDEGAGEIGAAVARWLALRAVDASAERELAVGDLARLAVILSRARDSRAATAFCERGGVSSLCALIDVESSPGTMFDCAKAIAGFCAALSDGSTTARFDVDGVARELRAILSSASGKMADPLPAVAATACRRALACLEKHAATRAGAATAVERQSSYGALGDCVAADRELDVDDASRSGSEASLHRAQKYDGSFGSQIELSRARSGSLNSSDASFSSPTKLVPAASVPEASASAADALFTTPPPLARKRSDSGASPPLKLKSPARARSKRRAVALRRFLLFLLFLFAVGVVLAFAVRLRARRA